MRAHAQHDFATVDLRYLLPIPIAKMFTIRYGVKTLKD